MHAQTVSAAAKALSAYQKRETLLDELENSFDDILMSYLDSRFGLERTR